MLIRALFVLSGLFVVGAVQSDIYGDLNLFHELQQQPYRVNWDWRDPLVNNRRAVEDDVSLEDDDSEREPLGRDYRDPPAASSEQKPVVVSKPKPDSTESSGKSEDAEKPQKPNSPFQGFLTDGIVDVNTDGFGGPLNPFNPDFDFTSSFGINTKPFGFGDLFNSFQSNQWWKGKLKPKNKVDVEFVPSPDYFPLNSFPSMGKPGIKEGRDEPNMRPPLDLDLYADDNENTHRKKHKKFLLDWEEY